MVEQDLAVYGGIGLQNYSKPVQNEVVGHPLVLQNLPTLYIEFPIPNTNVLKTLYAGSSVDLAAHGDRKFVWNAEGNWKPLGEELRNAVPAQNGLLVYFDLHTDLKNSVATWKLPDPNAGANAAATTALEGLPDYRVKKAVSTDETSIRFGRDAFPFRPVSVNIAPLVDFLAPVGTTNGVASARKGKVQARTTISFKTKDGQGGEGWDNERRVSFAILDEEQKTLERFVTGEVTGLSVLFDGYVIDAFRGRVDLDGRGAGLQMGDGSNRWP